MQEKPNEQVRLFIRDQTTGRHMFNPEALRALGIDPAEAQERGFQITPRSEAVQSFLNHSVISGGRIGVAARIPFRAEHFVLTLNYDVGLTPIAVIEVRKPDGILEGLAFALVRF